MSNSNQNIPFYIKNKSSNFVKSKQILSDRYAGIEKLLKLNRKNPIFTVAGKPAILFELCFTAESSGEFLRSDLSDEDKRKLLDFAYDKWTQNQVTHFDRLKESLGFDRQTYITRKFYALTEEELPKWLNEWIHPNGKFDFDRNNFLSHVGIQTENSPVVAIRKFLYPHHRVKETQIRPILRDIDPNLLQNTLRWLLEKNVNFISCDRSKLKFIKKIYYHLKFQEDLPLLVISSIDNSQISYQFSRVSTSEQVKYYYDSENFDSIKSEYELELIEFWKIIQREEALLIEKQCYPDSFNFQDWNKLEVKECLDEAKLSKCEEWDDRAYKYWHKEAERKNNNIFKIYLYEGEIPYEIYFDDNFMKSFSKGNIAIKNNNIYVSYNCIDKIENLLQELVSCANSNFTVNDRDRFRDARRTIQNDDDDDNRFWQPNDSTSETEPRQGTLDSSSSSGKGNPEWGKPGEQLAQELYEWLGYDVTRGESEEYDWHCKKDGKTRYVEVKTISSEAIRLPLFEWNFMTKHETEYDLLVVYHYQGRVKTIFKVKNLVEVLMETLRTEMHRQKITESEFPEVESLIGLQKDDEKHENIIILQWERLIELVAGKNHNIKMYSSSAQLIEGKRDVKYTDNQFKFKKI